MHADLYFLYNPFPLLLIPRPQLTLCRRACKSHNTLQTIPRPTSHVHSTSPLSAGSLLQTNPPNLQKTIERPVPLSPSVHGTASAEILHMQRCALSLQRCASILIWSWTKRDAETGLKFRRSIVCGKRGRCG